MKLRMSQPFLVKIKRLSLLNKIELTPILGFGLSKSGFMAAICKVPLNISSNSTTKFSQITLNKY